MATPLPVFIITYMSTAVAAFHPADVARLFTADSAGLISAAMLRHLYDLCLGATLHRRVQDNGHQLIVESAQTMRQTEMQFFVGEELDLEQYRRPLERRKPRPIDSGAVIQRQLFRSGARRAPRGEGVEHHIGHPCPTRLREFDLPPQLWRVVHCHVKRSARSGEPNPILNVDKPSGYPNHQLSRQVCERHVGAALAEPAASAAVARHQRGGCCCAAPARVRDAFTAHSATITRQEPLCHFCHSLHRCKSNADGR